MSKFIEIHWTCGSIDEARKVSRFLVQEKYVACANIIPWIESIYMWNNELETTQETKVVFKTVDNKFNEIKEIILQNCSYEVPEISKYAILDGNPSYLSWLCEQTT